MTKKRSLIPMAKARTNQNGKTGQPVTKLKKTKKSKILSKEVYDLTMKEIDFLMKKGEETLSKKDLERLEALSEAAENYEDTFDPLPVPSALSEMIRFKMVQLKIKQHFTAKLLGVSEAKFSLIMNGKQKPDIYFVKALHDKLKIDANNILQAL